MNIKLATIFIIAIVCLVGYQLYKIENTATPVYMEQVSAYMLPGGGIRSLFNVPQPQAYKKPYAQQEVNPYYQPYKISPYYQYEINRRKQLEQTPQYYYYPQQQYYYYYPESYCVPRRGLFRCR